MPLTTEQKRAALQQLQNDPSPEAQRVSERLQADIAEFDSQMASASSSDAKFAAPVAPAPASPAASGSDKPWWFFGPTGQAPDAANDPYRRMAPSGLERIGTPDDTSNLVIGGEEAFKRMADYAGAGAQAGLEHGIEGAKDVVRGIARPDDEGGVDWGRIGRGALQTGAGAASAAIQAVPTVGAMSGSGAMLRQAIADEEAQGYPVPLGVRLADLPTAGFEKFDEVVGGNVAKWTGSEDAGTLATLLGMGALFGGGKMAEGALRARLPSNIPGSTRPGLVGVRDAGPLVEPPTGLARRAPGGPPAAIPPTVPPPARLPFAPRGLPEPNGLRPQPDVPPPIPKDAVISPENRQLPTWQDPAFTRRQDLVREGTLTPGEAGIERGPRQPIIPPNRSFIKPTEPPADLPRGPVPGEGRQTPAPFARPVLESQPSTVGETLPARAPRTETDLGTASESSTALGRPTKRRQRPWTEEDQAQAEIQRDKEIAEAAKIDYAKIPENRLRLMADGDLNPFKRTAAEVEWRNRQGRPTDDIGAEIWWQERIDALEDQAVTKYGHDANSVKVRDDLSVGTDLEKLDPVLHAKIAFAERMRDERAPPMMTPEQRLPAPESIVGEPMPPVPRAETVPDYLPPEAGGATGLETPGETKPLHRSLTGEDLTPEQRVSGLVDRLLAEDPTADMRIIKVRARDQLRAAGEPLLLDDVLAKEIESRQFDESINPRPKGKTGAEIAEEPPPSPSTTKPPFRSGKGMGRNKGQRGEARVPDPKEIWESAKKGGRVMWDAYRGIAERTGNALQYDRISNAYEFLNRQLGKPIDYAFRKIGESKLVNTPFGETGRSVKQRALPKQKVIGGPFLDLVRRFQEGEKDVGAFHGHDALRRLTKALKGVSPETEAALRDYYQSRASTPPADAPPEALDLLEGATSLVNALRRRSNELKMLGDDQVAEYQRYLPRRFTDEQESVARDVAPRPGGPRIERNRYRRDGMGVIFNTESLRDIDPVAIAKEIDPHAVKLPGSGRVGVKFPERLPSGEPNPNFRENYETFMERIKAALKNERSEANQQLSGAVKGGRVDFARNAAKQRQQARTLNDIVAETFEPLSPEEMEGREQMPLNELVAYTIIRESNRVADGEFFLALSEAKDDAGVPYVLDAPADGYVRMKDGRLGALTGKHIREDVADYLQNPREIFKHSEFTNVLIRGIKRALTVLNPDSIARQYWSVPQFLMMYGMKNPFSPKALEIGAKAFDSVYREGSPAFLETMREGITGSVTFPETELSPSSPFARKKMGAGGHVATALQEPYMYVPGMKPFAEFMGRRYGEADKFARAIGYWYAKDKGMSGREAREFVNKFSQNYGEVGPLIDQARRSPFMSIFAAFRGELFRTTGNVLRERPLDALLAASYRVAVASALAASTMLLGDDREEITDEEREFILQNLGSQKVPITKDENGNILVGDVRFIDLWGDLIKRPGRLGEGGRGWAEFMLENVGADVTPTIRLGIDIGSGQTNFGERIWNQTDDLDEILLKSGLHAVQAFKPRWFPIGVEPNTGKFRPAGWNARQALSAATGEPYAAGRPPAEFYQPAIATILGLRITPENLAQRMDQLQKRKNRLLGNPDTGSRGELMAQYMREEIDEDDLVEKFAEILAEYDKRMFPDEPKKTRAPFAR